MRQTVYTILIEVTTVDLIPHTIILRLRYITSWVENMSCFGCENNLPLSIHLPHFIMNLMFSIKKVIILSVCRGSQ